MGRRKTDSMARSQALQVMDAGFCLVHTLCGVLPRQCRPCYRIGGKYTAARYIRQSIARKASNCRW